MLKRTKRSTAGNRYRQALANDLDDQEKEFFSTTYGNTVLALQSIIAIT